MNFRKIIAGHRGLLIAGIALGVLGAAAALAQPLFIGILIRAVTEGDAISGIVMFVVVLFIVDATLSAANAYLIGRAGENIVFDTRLMLASRLLRSKVASFQQYETGDIFTRMVGDTSLACMVITQALVQLVSSAFMVVGGILFMIWIDWRLLLATVTCLGLAGIASLLLARQVRIASLTNRQDTSAFGSGLQRVLDALTTIKASRAEERESDRIATLAGTVRRSGIRATAVGALLQPTVNGGTQVSLAVVIAWGMARVASGELHPADLTAFVMYLFYLVSPLVLLFLAIGQIQQGRAAVQRITELAEIPQEELSETASRDGVAIDSRPQDLESSFALSDTIRTAGPETGANLMSNEQSIPAVSFEQVGFSYADGSPALTNVTFRIPDRGLTAVVGPSGAGKTTLFQLIERFYHPDRGTVRVGGDDVADIPLERLRGKVGYVEQDSPLLRGTIRENLVYARPDADDTLIDRALRLASLHEFIDSLPQGLNTELGERGRGLSGGQRQRLAIARTLLQQPAVILLDEVTAHLDSDTESVLREAVTEAARECSVFTIAHRISTVAQAEQIIVLEEGAVRAIGSHSDLMATDELYRRLAEQQLQVTAFQ